MPEHKLAPLNNRSILQQVECPSQAKASYGAMQGVGFLLGEAFPEMIGYLFAYNFSGLGSNDKGFFGKAGFDTSRSGSKRILGYNYFRDINSTSTPANKRTKCSVSSGVCANKEPSYYIRSYPIARGGNLTFAAVEDMLDLNPVSVLKSAFSSAATGVSCSKVKLPVGSHFDFKGESVQGFNYHNVPKKNTTSLGYQKAFHFDKVSSGNRNAHHKKINDFVAQCDRACMSYWSKKDTRQYRLDNCRRDCRRIWWEEEQCIPKPAHTSKATYDNKKYKIPIGSAPKKQKSSEAPSLEKIEKFSIYTTSNQLKQFRIDIGNIILVVVMSVGIFLLCLFRR